MRIIAGSFGGRAIRSADGPGYRPATAKVRGAIFSMLESRGVVWSEARVLDLFAGSGSLGFEALSRGAPEVCFVEKASLAVAALRKTAEDFQLASPECRIIHDDVLRALRSSSMGQYNVIFIDPPYGENRLPSTLKMVLKSKIVAPEGFVLAEVEHRLQIDETPHQELSLLTNRTYGQTRILLWQNA